MAADEMTPAGDARIEFEKSRESAVRLLETLARKVGASRPLRTAAARVERASDYVRSSSVKELAAGIEEAFRRRPVYGIAIAIVAGFLVGRALRPKERRISA